MVQTLEFTVPELLERLQAGQIPMSAKVQVTFDDATLATNAAERDAAAMLFAQWEAEDAQLTPEQQAHNRRIYAEIETNGIPRVRL